MKRLLIASVLLLCVVLVGSWLVVTRVFSAPGPFQNDKVVTMIPAGPAAGGMVLPVPPGSAVDAVITTSEMNVTVLSWTWDWPMSSRHIVVEATVQNPYGTPWRTLLVGVLFDLTTREAVPKDAQVSPLEPILGYSPQTVLLTLATPLLPGEIRRITTAVDAPSQSLPQATRSYRNLWSNVKRFWRTPIRLWSPGVMLAPSLVVYGFQSGSD